MSVMAGDKDEETLNQLQLDVFKFLTHNLRPFHEHTLFPGVFQTSKSTGNKGNFL